MKKKELLKLLESISDEQEIDFVRVETKDFNIDSEVYELEFVELELNTTVRPTIYLY